MTSATDNKLITVFGGSGFLGRYVVRELIALGHRARVAVRNPKSAQDMKQQGSTDQVELVETNIKDAASVEAAIVGSDAVINLVGILQQTGNQKFDAVQEFGARTVAKAAKQEGASMVHMSAIGADSNSPSAYGSTKGKGEQAVFENVPSAVILRPSIVFGPEDDFFNRFGAMSRISPFLPLIGGGTTKFQPVYVGDVAKAVAAAIEGKLEGGKVYELGGPDIRTFRECLELLLEHINRKRLLVSMPWFAASTMGGLIGWVPGAPITADQVEMLKKDNVVSQAASAEKRTLSGIGITPTPMSEILPDYLAQYRPGNS